MKFGFIVCLSALALCAGGCATQPHTYSPPDATRLNASTKRVSEAVDKAHASAKRAQEKVVTASKKATEVEKEIKKLKDVPASVTQGLADLQNQLREAQVEQADLEKQLVEATNGKIQVEKDKAAYFQQGQEVANNATEERNFRIAAEQRASRLLWHGWLFRIAAGLFVLLIIAIVVLWVMGKVAFTFGKPLLL